MITRLFKFIYNRIRLNGLVQFPYNSSLALSSQYEGGNKIGAHTQFIGKMGYGSFIGGKCKLHANIGRFTSIASNCCVINGRHPYTYPYATTSPAFFSLLKQSGFTFAKRQMFEENKYAIQSTKTPIVIGSDCWINSDVKFVEGVKIGDGAVVLAGAMVTKDIPPYAIVGGIPARILKYRYSEEDIILLLKAKWWNRSREWLAENWEAFNNFEKLRIILDEGEYQ